MNSIHRNGHRAICFVSKVSWNGTEGCWERVVEIAEKCGAEVVLGEWSSESEHRSFALGEMKRRGFKHVFIPDGDEVIEPSLLKAVLKIAKSDLAEVVRCRMDTFFRSPRYVIRPREDLAPIILLDVQKCEHVHIREYSGERTILLGPEHGLLLHLSYAGPAERIKRKITTWSHKDELVPGWYQKVYLGWTPQSRNFHPTHPHCYGFAERIELPEILQGAFDDLPVNQDPEVPTNWPTLSVVIPLHGGPEDIRKCLSSLEKCQGLCHEVIVVDDVSPDEAPEVVKEFKFAKLIKNEENLGFAGTCNRGYEASTGEVALFLNSDTAVPRSGLIRLIETLMSSGTIGAAGPMTNNAGYSQQTPVTYTDISRLDLFARDFAHRDEEDEDVPMLVGFCLAVKRSALNELSLSEGDIPFDTRYKRGLVEDNDTCFRLLKAGYRLRLAKRAFVHHTGSQSLGRIGEHPNALLNRNLDIYHKKWKAEIESGYASHLPGQSASPIVFRPELKPERQAAKLRLLAQQADISLCMIVKDEERVLGACLASAKDAFTEVIVVDTGSTDRTIEIAKEHGADVYEHPWENSFSLARNHSLSYAKGAWVMWLDADDTISRDTAFRILQAVMSAPDDVMGFIVPVQFVEEGPGAGTRVDHVKIFRNLPGVHFEGRIHEQVLGSLREAMPHGRLARIDGAVVLHSGYDNSVEGQKKKAERDEGLLALELKERPDHPYVRFILGMTAHFRLTHEEAIKWLTECVELSRPEESHVRKAYALLALSTQFVSGPEVALSVIAEGLETVGQDAELLYRKGLILSEQGNFAGAIEAYLAMPLDISGQFSSIDIGMLTFKRSHNLALCYDNIGQYLTAKTWFKKALEEAPTFLPSAEMLFEASLKVGDAHGMREACNFIKNLTGPSELWVSKEVARLVALGESEPAALEQVIRQEPGAPAPVLILARQLLASDNESAAQQVLLQLEARGVAEAAFHLGVMHTRRGQFAPALNYMKRAGQLDPSHEQTQSQILALESALNAYPCPEGQTNPDTKVSRIFRRSRVDPGCEAPGDPIEGFSPSIREIQRGERDEE